MPAAPIPQCENDRLSALERYNILDTEVEEIFDRVTRMAKSMFQTPIALISLIDKNRQWFKSHAGLDASETPRDQAFCGYAILQSDVLVVEDATKDPRFSDNPLVTDEPHIRFYAGAQLVTHDGHALGTLCIIDQSPRQFLDVDKKLLEELATIAMNEIELRAANENKKPQKQFVNRDADTNTYNQKTFNNLFKAECERSRGHKIPLSLAVFELDGLDEIDNILGQVATDVVVHAFRDTCKSVMRPQDLIARLSRQGFALLMPNTKSESAEIVVRRLLRRVTTERPEYKGTNISYSVNAGVAQLSSSQKATDFYKEAEKNRCTAQDTGQNTYVASFAA